MKTVHICKAEGFRDEVNPGVTIRIDTDMPEFDYRQPLEQAGKFYEDQASVLFAALRDSLPGGTLDRLLGKMLAYKASHFRVLSWAEEKPEVPA
jgi:hypothetical protein